MGAEREAKAGGRCGLSLAVGAVLLPAGWRLPRGRSPEGGYIPVASCPRQLVMIPDIPLLPSCAWPWPPLEPVAAGHNTTGGRSITLSSRTHANAMLTLGVPGQRRHTVYSLFPRRAISCPRARSGQHRPTLGGTPGTTPAPLHLRRGSRASLLTAQPDQVCKCGPCSKDGDLCSCCSHSCAGAGRGCRDAAR